jgi:hypothetical protein
MRCAILLLAGLLAHALLANARGGELTPEQLEFFEKQVRPLFLAHCHECHAGDTSEGGLQLDSAKSIAFGGDSGAVVVAGKPDESLLVSAVGYRDEIKMPPTGKLADREIAVLRRWVEEGAYWPDAGEPEIPDASAPATAGEFQISERQAKWWAFQPICETPPPDVAYSQWPHDAVDAFLLATMEAEQLAPSPEAERFVWLRRVTFDLTGLPPTPEDYEAFLADDAPNANERVVDRLLASPAHGEKWARRWLDVVRYADYHDGDPKARDATCEPMEAWRYRDWVAKALNRDLPYNRFIVHQIAGDRLPSPEGLDFYTDGLVATTFLTNGAWDRGDADKEKMVSDMVDDQIDTIGKAFLGLTLGCARCHDHKFDPISQRDYYALAGIFYSTRILQELGAKGGNYTLQRIPLAPAAEVARRNELLSQLDALEARLAAIDKESPPRPSDDPERAMLVANIEQRQASLTPPPPYAEAATDGGTPGGLFPTIGDVPLHIRGSYTRLGEKIPRGMPELFAGDSQPSIESGSGRKELAEWIASTRQPLAARVVVNRLWQGHFGYGLAASPSNLGLTGSPPSHPELLDHLAARLVDGGWSLKELQRRLVLSAAYRQQSAGASPSPAIERDPENRLLARFPSRRLDAEEIRDAMLAASDRLDRRLGGPAGADLAAPRRSLYIQTARWDRNTFAVLFDAANPDASEERRQVSTVAPQSLFLLNHDFARSQAAAIAERLLKEAIADEQRVELAYRLLFGRSPSEEELAIAKEILGVEPTPAAWQDLTHVLFCASEFMYVD